jgi:hypothetical protein
VTLEGKPSTAFSKTKRGNSILTDYITSLDKRRAHPYGFQVSEYATYRALSIAAMRTSDIRLGVSITVG